MALRAGSVGLWSEAGGHEAGWVEAWHVGRSRTVERPPVVCFQDTNEYDCFLGNMLIDMIVFKTIDQ